MVIAVRGLTKRYRDVVAVDDISFDVESGSVFAFVGTNGAGKSTTIGCVTTVLPFDAGEISVAGRTGIPNCIFVETFASDGTAADRGFHLAVLA